MLSRLETTELVGRRNRFGPTTRTELLKNPLNERLDGLRPDAERDRDLGVRLSRGDELESRPFARARCHPAFPPLRVTAWAPATRASSSRPRSSFAVITSVEARTPHGAGIGSGRTD